MQSTNQTNFEHLQNLNPQQLEAVKHFEGPILVLAGAGSGKTRVLTRRVANLVLQHNVPTDQILSVTFTNKAAEEMRERLHALLGERSRGLWIATFHSAALRMLRRHAQLLEYSNDFVVYDDQDSKGLIKRILKEFGIDEKKFPPRVFSSYIDQCKNSFILPAAALQSAKDYSDKQQAEVYQRYQMELRRCNAMDFGDLLVNALLLLKNFPDVLKLYRQHLNFILVDEFQDTNKVQYLFIRYLSEPKRNLLVVGDDDQSIYAFRGATIRNILEFEKDFPETKVIKLEQNYRSTANVLAAAHAVIEKNSTRKPKKLWTDANEGKPVTLFVGDSEGDEANFVVRNIQQCHRAGLGFSKIAIFYRTNAQSRAIEEALLSAKIPYRIFGGLKFYERKEIKDILGYLKLIVNESDNQAFLRVVNTPPRGIGEQSIGGIMNHAAELSQSAMVAARTSNNKNIVAFIKLIDSLRGVAESRNLSTLISETISQSEYGPRLKAMKDPTAQSRVENLQELVAIGRSMDSIADTPLDCLRQFLDRVSLTSSSDIPAEEPESTQKLEAVSLMTLHLAKGLEFPVVFLVGAEEGLLPHYRSILDPVAIEEERRLCYVGITRAMEQLFVTRARSRGMFSSGDGFGFTGSLRDVSRFIRDIPGDVMLDLSDDFFAEAVKVGQPTSNSNYTSYDNFGGPTPSKQWGKVTNFRSPTRSSSNLREGGLGGIKTADQLNSSENHRLWSPNLALISAEEIELGKRVMHPSFGPGVIEQIDGANDSQNKLKLHIKFDEQPEPKRLIFKYARLAHL